MKKVSSIVVAVAVIFAVSQANAAKHHHKHHTASQARIANAFAAFAPVYAYAPAGLATLDFGACARIDNGNPDSICNHQNGFNR